MSEQNLYEILGVSKDASMADIKKAYKKLAMKYHPDKGGDSEIFKKVSEAYSILSDEEKRQRYDQFGTVDMSDVQMPDLSEIFGNIFGGGFPFGGSGRGNPFGFSSRPPTNTKSSDRIIHLDVSLEEVMKGSTIPFRLHRKKYFNGNKCKECNGVGHRVQQINISIGFVAQNMIQCNACDSSGVIYDEKDVKTIEEVIQVPLPKGIPNGNKLIIRGKSNEYPNKQSGDVILIVKYQKHGFYQIQSSSPLDIHCQIPLTLKEFLCGFQKKITLLDGQKLLISQPNIVFQEKVMGSIQKVIKNYGFSYRNHTGNLVIEFILVFPKKITSELLNSLPTDSIETNKDFLQNITSSTGSSDSIKSIQLHLL